MKWGSEPRAAYPCCRRDGSRRGSCRHISTGGLTHGLGTVIGGFERSRKPRGSRAGCFPI